MLEKTIAYAIEKHLKMNHKYGTKDYAFHLNMVYEVSRQFIYLIPEEDRENVNCDF